MKTILTCCAMILLMTVGNFAQQPGQQPHFQQRLQSIIRAEGPPSTKNYQLELSIQRGEKTARYKVTLNSGAVSTELIDRLAEKHEGMAPITMSLSVTLSPMDEGAFEAQVNLNRAVMFKTKVQAQGGQPEKESVSFKTIPLMTKVALLPGKPVTLFEDDDEKIALKLTSLDADAENK
jgi:hypothetical protein